MQPILPIFEQVTKDNMPLLVMAEDHIVLLSAAGDKHAIKERCGSIRVIIDNSTSEYEMDKLKERLAKLTGGIAVIKVGGASEVEVNEVKGRLNDALCATKAALEGHCARRRHCAALRRPEVERPQA